MEQSFPRLENDAGSNLLIKYNRYYIYSYLTSNGCNNRKMGYNDYG